MQSKQTNIAEPQENERVKEKKSRKSTNKKKKPEIQETQDLSQSNAEPKQFETVQVIVVKEKKSKIGTNRKKKNAHFGDLQEKGKKQGGKQVLLTNYIKKKGNNESITITNTNTSTLSTLQYLNPPNNKESLLELEQQINKKNAQIQQLREEKEVEKQKTNKLAYEFNQLNNRTKHLIVQSKKELAEHMRKERGKIKPEYGSFKQNGNSFVQGQYLLKIKTNISDLQKRLKEQQSEFSHIKQEDKLQQSSKIQYTKIELSNYKLQLQVRQKQIDRYMQRLRLYNMETKCTFYKEKWPLLKNKYQPLQLIGYGGFGQVYRGFDVERFQDVAIKLMIIDKARVTEKNAQLSLRYLQRQMQIHKALHHPNIVRMVDQIQFQQNKFCIVMQYCNGPDLKSYLRKDGCLDQRQAKHIIKQVIYAVKYLQDQKYRIIHYDLKPANILFHQGVVKVVDFGISKKIQAEEDDVELTTQGLGTFWYLPPEVFQQNGPKVSGKVDVWSIGVIFFQMLYGRKPFAHGFSQTKILNLNLIKNCAQKVQFPAQSPKKYRISQEAKQFIEACLKYEANDRLSPLQAYEHDYIKY